MHKSIVKKYFWFCTAIIFASVVCMGTILLLVASQFYKNEKKDILISSMAEVRSATNISYISKGNIDKYYLISVYKNYALSVGAEFTLTDSDGKLIVCSEPEPCVHTGKSIPKSVLNSVNEDSYFSVGNMDGFYNESYFNMGMSVDLDGKTHYLFSKMTAAPLERFYLQLIKMFIITTAAAMVVIYIIVYFFTKQISEPINDMIKAARRFEKGDFSEKIQVNEDNEIGVLAASMNDMAYSLSKLENTRRSFVANVSHELKTPMTTIGGFVDGILDGTIPEEHHRYYLGIVSGEISRLARLVRSMLNIAKYETGEMELKYETFDVTTLTIKTVLLFEKQIEDKKVEIIGLDSDSFLVNADIDLIQQVIYNLVENAVKFVDDGGYISFKYALDISEKKTITSIRNSGEGLTHDELPKVFDRFYKTDESHGKDKTGVGLGLSIVRSIVNLHDGKITVRSTKNEFTEFSFTIPTADKSEG